MYELALKWDAEHGNVAAAREFKRIMKKVSRGDGKNTETVQAVNTAGDKMNELATIIFQGNVAEKQTENTGDNTKTLMYMMMALAIIVVLKK